MRNKMTHCNSMRRTTGYCLVVLVSLFAAFSWAASENRPAKPVFTPRRPVKIAPAIPTAKRNPQLVFLEHADELLRKDGDPYMILVGNVEFSKGGMRMYTDSAHYYDADGSFNAYGNICMQQGDTLFIYADELNYNGLTEVADLFGYNGKPVRLINRDVKLETDIFTYDMYEELCFYTTGGVLTDRDNRLESIRGEYSPSTKEANFYDNVILTSHSRDDELRLLNEALYYNTESHLAEFHVPTVITNKDGRIDSDDGVYNTETRIAELYEHSIVTTSRGSTLEGDTLYYDRAVGVGEAWGSMALVDTVRQSTLMGDYGYYNEISDSAFVTGRAVAMEYSKGDTLYIHGRYLTSVLRVDSLTRNAGQDTVFVEAQVDEQVVMESDTLLSNAPNTADVPAVQLLTDSISGREYYLTDVTEEYADSTHIVSAWPRVRIFRTDMQGLCDSLVFTQADSVVRMFYHPIVWSEDRQIFGNIIMLHVNDSTVESATLPETGFMAQHIEGQHYNQLSGKSMKAWFENGKLHRMLVEGSVEGIVYPEENDSTINKLITFKTANLEGFFKDQVMERMKMWAETSGEAIPMYLVRASDLFLPGFIWYEGLRPLDPDDIFVISPEMEQLMSDRPLPDLPVPDAPDVEQEPADVTEEVTAEHLTPTD